MVYLEEMIQGGKWSWLERRIKKGKGETKGRGAEEEEIIIKEEERL